MWLARPDTAELSLEIETKARDTDRGGTVVVHHYELVARLLNKTKRRLDDWYIEAELPTQLLEPCPVDGSFVAILHGIASRGIEGTVNASSAVETGARAKLIADIGWKKLQDSGAV